MHDTQKKALVDLVQAIRVAERTGRTRAYGEIFDTFCPCCGAVDPAKHAADCALRRIRDMLPTVVAQIDRGAPSSRPGETTAEFLDPATPIPEAVPVVEDGIALGFLTPSGKDGWIWRCVRCGSYEEHDPWSATDAHRSAVQHTRRCNMRTDEV